MKTMFKQVLAVAVIGALAAGSVLTASAATVTVSDNTNTPAAAGSEATVILNVEDFAEVAGADLDITLADGITFKSIAAEGTTWVPVVNENYAVNGNKIKIVDVFNMTGADAADNFVLKLTVTTPSEIGTYTVSTSGQTVNSSEADVTVNYVNGAIVIGKKAETKTVTAGDTSLDDGSGTSFVPYGAAYFTNDDSSVEFLVKNEDGTFVIPEGVSNINLTRFKLPDAAKGITTFGASSKPADPDAAQEYAKHNGIQFGSYVTASDESKTYGTLVTIGNFASFSDFCATKFGCANETDVFNKIVELCAQYNVPDGTFLKLTYNQTETIFVGLKARTTYQWLGANAELQYALRVYNVSAGTDYTAVGYVLDSDTYTFSTEIKTAQYTE